MNVKEIKELMAEFDNSSMTELTLTMEDVKLELKKASPSVNEIPLSASPSLPNSVLAELNRQKALEAANSFINEPEEVQPDQTETYQKITSPMVGTFYSSPSPEAAAYVKPGSRVVAGTIVCIVEAMKLFNEIESEINGEIVEVLAENGQLVEYGQPLFLVKPN